MRLIAAFAAGLAVCQLATLLTTVYLHRALSHRALVLRPGAALVLRALLWVTTGIRAREWVAVHRKHHAFSDTEGDPHSPLLEGFAMVQFGNVALYRRALRDGLVVRRYARDLPPDRWDRALFDHALLGLGLGVGALCLVLGPWAGLLAALVHTVAYLLLNAAINAVGHLWGRRPFGNRARNNQWLAWLTAGEGLHNNHHAAPTSAKLALGRREVDPAWPFVRLLVRRGWATVRLDEAQVRAQIARSAEEERLAS
jgi:stearoyl-CoA desaturase (delta-9 desaturase)